MSGDLEAEWHRHLRTAMNALDIFQKLPGGTRMWVCGAGSVQEAKARLLELQQAEPAEYFACDLAERSVVAAITRERPELHTVGDDSEFFGSLPSHSDDENWRRAVSFQGRSASRHLRWAAR